MQPVRNVRRYVELRRSWHNQLQRRLKTDKPATRSDLLVPSSVCVYVTLHHALIICHEGIACTFDTSPNCTQIRHDGIARTFDASPNCAHIPHNGIARTFDASPNWSPVVNRQPRFRGEGLVEHCWKSEKIAICTFFIFVMKQILIHDYLKIWSSYSVKSK
jgi:hypothetical protein